MEKKLETNSSTLPEFEAELRGEKYYALDKEKVGLLLAEKLRTIKKEDFDSLLNWGFYKDSNEIYTHSGRLKKNGLQDFYDAWVKNNLWNSTGWSEGTKIGGGAMQGRILFDIDIIFLKGNNLILKNKEKYGKGAFWQTTPEQFLQKGLSALGKYTGSVPEMVLYSSCYPVVGGVKWSKYVLAYNVGENLSISYDSTDNNAGTTTIPATGGYDFFNKGEGGVNDDVVVVFKPDYVEFWKVGQGARNTDIGIQKYTHLGKDFVEYEEHGNLVQGKLDPNKNFIVGIFEEGSSRCLKILRLTDATLMYTFPDIKEIVGFDNADIVCYDTTGNLRSIDCNFESFPLCYSGTIQSLNDENDESLKVHGGCSSWEEVFAHHKYPKILAGLLSLSNPLLSKQRLDLLLEKIRTQSIISTAERDGLLTIFYSENNPFYKNLVKNGNAVMDKIKIKDMKRGDLLFTLLKSDADEPLQAYKNMIEAYPYVLDADTIQSFGNVLFVVSQGATQGVYLKSEDNLTSLFETIYDKIDVKAGSAEGQRKLSLLGGGSRRDIVYDVENNTTVSETVSSDAYEGEVNFTPCGIGIARLKKGGKLVLVKKNGQHIDEISSTTYREVTWRDDVGIFLLVGDTGSRIAVPNDNHEISISSSTFYTNPLSAGALYVKDNNYSLLVKPDVQGFVLLSWHTGGGILQEADLSSYSYNKEFTIKKLSGGEKKVKNDFANLGEWWLKDSSGSYSLLCIGKDNTPTFGDSYSSLCYLQEGKTIGGTYTDSSGNLQYRFQQKSEDGEYTTIYEGPILAHLQKGSKICVKISDNSFVIYDLSDTGIKQLTLDDIVSLLQLSQKNLLEEVLVGDKKILLQCIYENGILQKILVSDYTDIGKKTTYGSYTYQGYFVGGKRGLIYFKDDKMLVLQEPFADKKPSFSDTGCNMGGKQWEVDEDGLFHEVSHDFDQVEEIPGTIYYICAQNNTWVYGEKKDHAISRCKDSPTLMHKPVICDTHYLIEIQDSNTSKLYDITQSGLPGNLLQEYAKTIIYHGYDIFSFPEDDGSYRLILGKDNFLLSKQRFVTQLKNLSSKEGKYYRIYSQQDDLYRLFISADENEKKIPLLIKGDKNARADLFYQAMTHHGSNFIGISYHWGTYDFYYIHQGEQKMITKMNLSNSPDLLFSSNTGMQIYLCKTQENETLKHFFVVIYPIDSISKKINIRTSELVSQKEIANINKNYIEDLKKMLGPTGNTDNIYKKIFMGRKKPLEWSNDDL